MSVETELLWKPLLEAAAQTIVGAIGGYAFTEVLTRATGRITFDGSMDFWKRGIRDKTVGDGDQVVFDGLISPYSQLFPGDPLENAVRWNTLYKFQGKINSDDYQAMEFFAGSDAALRISSLNGETLVGLYARYGFIGEGLVGVVPTKLLLKAIPDFFHKKSFGVRARISGRIALCPAQHGFVAQSIARKSGMQLDVDRYKDIYYLQVNRIAVARQAHSRTCSLLGSAWGLTDKGQEQYLVQYGYISEPGELRDCHQRIIDSKAWQRAQVFYDELNSPSDDLSFRKRFIS